METLPSSSVESKATEKCKKGKSNHPLISVMVTEAIESLWERHGHHGSSLQAIKKFISSIYKVDIDHLAPFINKYIKKALAEGKLIQTKGKGAQGSFKLNPMLSQMRQLGSKQQTMTAAKPKKPLAAKNIIATCRPPADFVASETSTSTANQTSAATVSNIFPENVELTFRPTADSGLEMCVEDNNEEVLPTFNCSTYEPPPPVKEEFESSPDYSNLPRTREIGIQVEIITLKTNGVICHLESESERCKTQHPSAHPESNSCNTLLNQEVVSSSVSLQRTGHINNKSQFYSADRVFVLLETALLQLFTFCRLCFASCTSTVDSKSMSMVVIHTECKNGHALEWQSLPGGEKRFKVEFVHCLEKELERLKKPFLVKNTSKVKDSRATTKEVKIIQLPKKTHQVNAATMQPCHNHF